MSFQLHSRVNLCENEPLARHTTFRIGGKARYFCTPHTLEDLCTIISWCHEKTLPYFILGNGSNVLCADAGYPGVIISMIAYDRDRWDVTDTRVTCSAGIMIPTLLTRTAEAGLGGLAFLSSIPGTLGGAVRQNTSAFGTAIGERIIALEVFDVHDKRVVVRPRASLDFRYRSCTNLKGIIVGVTMHLFPSSKKDIVCEMEKNYNYRKEKHDIRFPSAGCIFKNPKQSTLTAGQLIDQCGLKGYRVGDAQISEQHANYIVNRGNASAEDVLHVVQMIRETVQQKFHIDLEMEVEYVA